MKPSSTPYSRLYGSARQAIKDAAAAAAAGTPDGGATGEPTTTQRQQDSLKNNLDRLLDEASRAGDVGAEERDTKAKGAQKSSNAVFDVTAEWETSSEDGSDAGKTEAQKEEERADECLGLMAEAFADDLDLLRKDEHFKGSATNLAAMADMMRCLAGGLSSTEQKMLIENATR
ncbi:unnamed protein product [Scytosiphon promiscuus]